ncbi:MAG: hypothetical protein WBM17_03890 [Anaerolineales bacterium]
MKRHPLLVFGLMLVFFSLACQSVPFLAHPTPTPTTTPTPTQTPTPTGIPGITLPVTVSGVQIKFTDLHEESEILFGTERYTPKSSSDTFIVAVADVLTSGTTHQEVADWAVSLNQDISWVFMQSHGDTNSITSVEWTFVVSKSTSAYRIHLPGGVDVELSSLLR